MLNHKRSNDERLQKLKLAAVVRTNSWCIEASFQAYRHEYNGGFVGDGWRSKMLPGSRVQIEVDGGVKELAQVVGSVPEELQHVPYDTLVTYCTSYLPTYKQYTIAESITQTNKNKKSAAKISIVLSPLWVKAYSDDGPRVPVMRVPPLASIPSHLHTSVEQMEMSALIRLVDNRSKLLIHGAIELDWYALGAKEGLSRSVVDDVLNEWCAADRWRREDAGWRLGDSEQVRDARQMIHTDALNELTKPGSKISIKDL